ncbi:hypothetical protein BDA99DRAFT_535268 [Phascolomyces articulosus]|uniref:Uncharacterized protein n=1 Tax=Phascolomyces articulosus TaxID=60185 RepID=A0AAD5PI06_9FUNG|nr:hypothetical protein BDA99DRAFT_535268 [Phascolomyces articulosus]
MNRNPSQWTHILKRSPTILSTVSVDHTVSDLPNEKQKKSDHDSQSPRGWIRIIPLESHEISYLEHCWHDYAQNDSVVMRNCEDIGIEFKDLIRTFIEFKDLAISNGLMCPCTKTIGTWKTGCINSVSLDRLVGNIRNENNAIIERHVHSLPNVRICNSRVNRGVSDGDHNLHPKLWIGCLDYYQGS